MTGQENIPHVTVIGRAANMLELAVLETFLFKETNPVINASINDLIVH